MITASCLSHIKIHPYRTLNIEAYRKRAVKPQLLFLNRVFLTDETDYDVLMKLYGIVETGNTIDVGSLALYYYTAIFDKNELYSYSPAEWAVLNDKTEVLVFFLVNSLQNVTDPIYIFGIFENLFITSIQLGKFNSFKSLRQRFSDSSTETEYYMALAAKHHASETFWCFLFDERVVPCFIRKSSLPEYYGEVLAVAVRFNNILAARMLIEQGAVIHSALEIIMARNRQRLLDNVIHLNICQFKDEDGLGLLHYAVKHSNDRDMITLIFQKCPSICPDIATASDCTPLKICLDRTDSNVETIADTLIFNGADIFIKRKSQRSSLERIIGCRMKSLFSFILSIYFEIDSHMTQFIDMCISYESWSLLDEILISRPDLIASLKLQLVSVDSFATEYAPITFRIFLEKELIVQDEDELIEWLLQNNSDVFTKITLDCGISHRWNLVN